MNKKQFFLVSILLLAFILRIYSITDVPAGFYTDEVDIGLNAYTIFNEGIDAHGVKFPLLFESLGDYKTPLYIYLISPFIGIFGLNEFNLRLMPVIIGVLTVLFTYFLTKEMFGNKAGLLASLLLTISPWHFHFSRIGFEAILSPLIIVLGLYLLIKATKTKKLKYFLLSALIFILGTYAYPVMKGFIPLLLIGYLFLNRKIISKKYLFLFLIIVITFSFPAYIHQGSTARLSYVSIFGEKAPITLFIKNYFSYLSPNFLIFNGDSNPRHSISNFGQLYLIEALFLFLGLIFLFKKFNKNACLLLWWFFIFPITASITYSPHAIRSIVALPVIQIISALGILWFYSFFKKSYKKYILILITLVFLINSCWFFHSYFTIYPEESAFFWYAGIGELYKETDKIVNDYEEVLLSDKIGYEGVKSYLHFYSKYPEKYRITKNPIPNINLNKNQLIIIRNSKAPKFETFNTIIIYDTPVFKFFSTEEIKKALTKKQGVEN